MLVAAALVPDTALLVPGVAGSLDPLPALREAAVLAVRRAAAGADRVVVVAPGPADATPSGVVRGSFAAAGVPDRLLGWDVPEVRVGDADAPHVPAVATSLALHLLARSGVDLPVRLVELARAAERAGDAPAAGEAPTGGPPQRAGRAADLAALGSRLAGDAGERVALVVVGSGSARHGPDAPLADDDRAPALDASLTTDLADAGPGALARLTALDEQLAADLAVSGWPGWQVLLGAVRAAVEGDRVGGDDAHRHAVVGGAAVTSRAAAGVDAEVLARDTGLGAHHLVALWTLRTAGPSS